MPTQHVSRSLFINNSLNFSCFLDKQILKPLRWIISFVRFLVGAACTLEKQPGMRIFFTRARVSPISLVILAEFNLSHRILIIITKPKISSRIASPPVQMLSSLWVFFLLELRSRLGQLSLMIQRPGNQISIFPAAMIFTRLVI